MPDTGTIAALVGGGGLAVATVGALSGWLVARRSSSGRIDTSEASQLWQAAETLRHDLTAQLSAARTEVASLSVRNETLRAEVATLRAEVATLRAEGDTLRAENRAARAEADAWWRAQIDELRADAARQHRQEMAAIRREKKAQEG